MKPPSRSLPLLLGLAAPACVGAEPRPAEHEARQLVPLRESVQPLRSRFDALADRTRVVALLSPT